MSQLVLGSGQLSRQNLNSLKNAMWNNKPLSQEQQNTLDALNQYQTQQNNLKDLTNIRDIPVHDIGFNFSTNTNPPNTINMSGPDGKQTISNPPATTNNYFISNPNPQYNYFTKEGISKIQTDERKIVATEETIDGDFDTNAFLPKLKNLPGYYRSLVYYTPDIFKFYSTKFGVTYSVNMKPSFTRTCDIKLHYGIMDKTKQAAFSLFKNEYGLEFITNKDNTLGLGMGRYYSNVIDNNSNKLLLNFGIPKINSLANYLSTASVAQQRLLAKYGYIPKGYTLAHSPFISGGLLVGLGTFLFGISKARYATGVWGKTKEVLKGTAKAPINAAKIMGKGVKIHLQAGIGAFSLMKNLFGVAKYIPFGRTAMLISTAVVGAEIVSRFQNRIFSNNQYRYYDVEVTPHLYWGAVSNIINAMMVELDAIEITRPYVGSKGKDVKGSAPLIGIPQTLGQDSMKELMTMLPEGIFTESSLTGSYFLDAYKAGIGGQKLLLGQMILLDKTRTQQNKSSFADSSNNGGMPYRIPFMSDYLTDNKTELKELIDFNKSWIDIFNYQTNVMRAGDDILDGIAESLGSGWSSFKDFTSNVFSSKAKTEKEKKLEQQQEEAKQKALIKSESNRVGQIYSYDNLNLAGFGVPQIYSKSNDKSKKDAQFIIDNNIIGKVPDVTKPAANFMYGPKTVASSTQDWRDYIEKLDKKQKSVKHLKKGSWFDSVMNNFMQLSMQCASNLVLDVEIDKDTSFTIMNETGEMEVANMINQGTQFVNQVRFNMDSLGAQWVKTLQRNLDGMMQGIMENPVVSFFRPLSSLLKGAFIDFPHIWKSSQIEIPSKTFSIDLVSPYGNKLSQIQNIYFPLACLLAGALPRAVGPASLTSPFLCKAFLQSSLNIDVGLISDITISKGITNISYNNNKQCLSINVRFTVLNLDQFIATPAIDYNSLMKDYGNMLKLNPFGSPSFSRFLGELCGRNYWNNESFMFHLRKNIKTTIAKLTTAFHQPFLVSTTNPTLSKIIGNSYLLYNTKKAANDGILDVINKMESKALKSGADAILKTTDKVVNFMDSTIGSFLP